MNLAWTLISRGVVLRMAGFLAVLSGLAGCSGDGAEASTGGVDSDAVCPSGEVRSPSGGCECPAATVPRAGGGCQPSGLPLDMACPPGETPLADGGCEPAGVAPEACGEGFEPDGKRGCNAIVPEEDCPAGLMAIPGETKCREVAPCGNGTWGDIPVEGDTVFVDGSYSGGDSDGTKAKPWTTLQDGIDEAAEGAIVAVAAGSYKESAQINHKRVRLWGRCPSMVEVEGVAGKQYSLIVYYSDGAEVRGLALTGPSYGLVAVGSMDVIADQIWVHHTGDIGILVEKPSDPANITVSSSLIEATASSGVVALGASVTLERSVVRDTAAPDWAPGVQAADKANDRASMKVRSSVISRTQWVGVHVRNSSVQIEATLIRDTRLDASGNGAGVLAFLDGKGGASGGLTIRTSVIEDSGGFGLAAYGPGLSIEATVVRGTRPQEDGDRGVGVSLAGNKPERLRGGVTIRGSLVEDNYETGLRIVGSDALIEGTIVRDTKEGMNLANGLGVSILRDEDGKRANATLRSLVIERSVSGGIVVEESDATIETSIITDTKPNAKGLQAYGVTIQRRLQAPIEPAIALVRSCLIERSVSAGVIVTDSDATIETSHVRDVQPNVEGILGDGILVVFLKYPTTARLYGTHVESTARAGLASFGGSIEMDKTAVTCGVLDINGETHNGTDFVFDDRGGTACGCPAATDRCHVQSAGSCRRQRSKVSEPALNARTIVRATGRMSAENLSMQAKDAENRAAP